MSKTMAKRTEVVEMSEDDIKEAIIVWLNLKYQSGADWKVVLQHHPVYDETPYFTAVSEREV